MIHRRIGGIAAVLLLLARLVRGVHDPSGIAGDAFDRRPRSRSRSRRRTGT